MPDLKPRQPAPDLSFSMLGAADWALKDAAIEQLLLVIVYRGAHCPACQAYLETLNGLLPKFADQGVSVVAVSGDPRDRAERARKEWAIADVPLGFGLTEAQMRAWGLFVSDKVAEKETPRFAEPGLFLIKPDRTVYYAALSSMPFGRPDLNELADKVGWLLEKEYPARGEA